MIKIFNRNAVPQLTGRQNISYEITLTSCLPKEQLCCRIAALWSGFRGMTFAVKERGRRFNHPLSPFLLVVKRFPLKGGRPLPTGRTDGKEGGSNINPVRKAAKAAKEGAKDSLQRPNPHVNPSAIYRHAAPSPAMQSCPQSRTFIT